MYIPSLSRNLARTYPLSLNEVLVSLSKGVCLFFHILGTRNQSFPVPSFQIATSPNQLLFRLRGKCGRALVSVRVFESFLFHTLPLPELERSQLEW